MPFFTIFDTTSKNGVFPPQLR